MAEVSVPKNVGQIMALVLVALVPGTTIFIFQTGWGGLFNLALAILSAVVFEAITARLRQRNIRSCLADGSAVVTGWLIALCLPPLLAWWLPVLASGFAILLAKQLFGGLGHNIFNPAMVGYALVLVSFPLDLGIWVEIPDAFSIGFSKALETVTTGGLHLQVNWDALTGATPLDQHRNWLLQAVDNTTPPQHTFGMFGGANTEWVNAGFLVGGLWLIHKRVIQWHIPAAFLLALSICSVIGNALNPLLANSSFHLFSGATMLGAFFIATDPVTAAASKRGRLLYAAGAGFLLYLIRVFGAYPDAIAFAILLMNCAVPAIDRMDIWWSGKYDRSP